MGGSSLGRLPRSLWKMSGLSRFPGHAATQQSRHSTPYMVGTYLAAGEGGLDFDRFSKAALAGRQPGSAHLDVKVWGTLARQNFHTMQEIEQEPSMSICHLSHEFTTPGAPRSIA